MNLIVFMVLAILYLALIGITVGNMKVFDIKTKTIYLIIGLIINLLITAFIISITKININIDNAQAYNIIKKIDILIFTAVNSIITLPTIGKYLTNTKIEINTKEQISKKIIILLIIYILILILEVNYIKGLKV